MSNWRGRQHDPPVNFKNRKEKKPYPGAQVFLLAPPVFFGKNLTFIRTGYCIDDMTDEWVSGSVRLSVGGQPLELGFTVPSKPVKLRRMLPVFQQMSNTFNEMGVENLKSQGKAVSCRAGCGACCRQLVPVSEAEAYNLRDLIEEMPEPRRTEIRQRFEKGMEKLNRINFFRRLGENADKSEEDYTRSLQEYFRQQIPCPFLENESCSIHESRPIACRDYFVTSPPEYCASATGENVEKVEHVLKVKDSLIALSRNVSDASLPFVPLIGLLKWTDKVPDRSPARAGKVWMEMFFRELMENSRK